MEKNTPLCYIVSSNTEVEKMFDVYGNLERINKHRQISCPLYRLNKLKKKRLSETHVDVVFSAAFLNEFPAIGQHLTERQLLNRCASIVAAAKKRDLETFGALVSKEFKSWAGYNGTGFLSLSLLLDTATAFGFEIPGAPAFEQPLSDRAGELGELATLLKGPD